MGMNPSPAGESPPADFTQRAMPLESVVKRAHVYEEKNPAEARRRRGWWPMSLRLCGSAGESPPTDAAQTGLPAGSREARNGHSKTAYAGIRGGRDALTEDSRTVPRFGSGSVAGIPPGCTGFFGTDDRWYRFARPPATCRHPSGMLRGTMTPCRRVMGGAADADAVSLDSMCRRRQPLVRHDPEPENGCPRSGSRFRSRSP